LESFFARELKLELDNLSSTIELANYRAYQTDLETILRIREEQVEKIFLRARKFVEEVVREFFDLNEDERKRKIDQLMVAFDDDQNQIFFNRWSD